MDLVRDVFREALRLYPPVGFFARECTVSTQMRDKQVEKGSSIVIAPWLIQRHRDYWDRPDDFDPYRYAKDKMKVPLRDAFLPFGMGPRVCIGTAFAMQEGVLILATLLQKYKMALAPGFTPQPVGRLTVRSENGMQMILTKRNIG
jgi:cytochrome P450